MIIHEIFHFIYWTHPIFLPTIPVLHRAKIRSHNNCQFQTHPRTAENCCNGSGWLAPFAVRIELNKNFQVHRETTKNIEKMAASGMYNDLK